MYVCMYIYIYIYAYIGTDRLLGEQRDPARRPRRARTGRHLFLLGAVYGVIS